jgi:creatinine amidohydrolase
LPIFQNWVYGVDMKYFLLIWLLVYIPANAYAQSFYLEDLTWPEVKERQLKGTDSIIIPSGGTEQNGPHIAIGKHNWIVRYTSGEIAKKLGNALAAPVIAYVPEGAITPPEGHMRFTGTISLRNDAFAMILEDTARSFKQHGFKRIYFIGDSGGNQNAQQAVADKLSKEWKSEGITVLHVGEYYTDQRAVDWVKSKNLGGKDAQAHAGFMDTAEVMASHPQGIRAHHIRSYSDKDFDTSGVMGDPTGATKLYGETLLQFKIDAAVERIKAARNP